MKKLIVIRGIPSSGKSTLAKKLAEENNGLIFSTDNFFMKDGKYNFSFVVLDKAHQWNKSCVDKAMWDGEKYLIIDNTNTTWDEIYPYVRRGIDFNYQISIIEPDNPERFDVKKAFERNTHGVPMATLQKMVSRWVPTEEIIKKVKELGGNVTEN